MTGRRQTPVVAWSADPPVSEPLVSVLVMAFNEALNLPAVVDEIHGVLSGLGQPFEMVIIDDGSTDVTSQVAEKLAQQLPSLRVVHHPENQGLGGVYRTGFREARGQFVTFFPADGQFPATILCQFLPLMGNCDLVLGYLPKRDSPFVARFLSFAERMVYLVLFGPMPRFQGVLMFRRELLSRIPLQSTGRSWVVLMEFILRAVRSGVRLRSEPTTMRPRLSGHSKVNNWKTIRAHLRHLLALYRVL
jgi:glycosyltransferase involved in cell wall biosynthesis